MSNYIDSNQIVNYNKIKSSYQCDNILFVNGGEFMYKRLKALRQVNEMTQHEVAELLGINSHTYFNKETGKTVFTINEAKKLSDLFGASIEDIFFESDVINLITNSS